MFSGERSTIVLSRPESGLNWKKLMCAIGACLVLVLLMCAVLVELKMYSHIKAISQKQTAELAFIRSELKQQKQKKHIVALPQAKCVEEIASFVRLMNAQMEQYNERLKEFTMEHEGSISFNASFCEECASLNSQPDTYLDNFRHIAKLTSCTGRNWCAFRHWKLSSSPLTKQYWTLNRRGEFIVNVLGHYRIELVMTVQHSKAFWTMGIMDYKSEGFVEHISEYWKECFGSDKMQDTCEMKGTVLLKPGQRLVVFLDTDADIVMRYSSTVLLVRYIG